MVIENQEQLQLNYLDNLLTTSNYAPTHHHDTEKNYGF